MPDNFWHFCFPPFILINSHDYSAFSQGSPSILSNLPNYLTIRIFLSINSSIFVLTTQPKFNFMNKHLLLLLSCIFIFQFGYTQAKSEINNYPNWGIMQYKVITEDNVSENEIYQNELFQKGKLTTKENLELNALKFRYNIKTDEIECRVGAQHSIINFPQAIKEISIDGTCYEYQKYLVKKDTANGYLLKLHGGDQTIYAKYYIPKNKTIAPESKTYYLLKNKGQLPKKISSIRSTITNHFGKQEKEIRDYDRKNNINWNNPMDLKKLISYLSSLKQTM